MAEPPGVVDGLIGIFGEIRYAFTVTKRCPGCGSSWTGHYPRRFMDYCHHCGEELVNP